MLHKSVFLLLMKYLFCILSCLVQKDLLWLENKEGNKDGPGLEVFSLERDDRRPYKCKHYVEDEPGATNCSGSYSLEELGSTE